MRIERQLDGTFAIVDSTGAVIQEGFASAELAAKQPVNIKQSLDGKWSTVNFEGTVIKAGFKDQDSALNAIFPESGGNPKQEAIRQAQARVDEVLATLKVNPPQKLRNELRNRVSQIVGAADELDIENVLESLTDKSLTDLYITSARTLGDKKNKEIESSFTEAFDATVLAPIRLAQKLERDRSHRTEAGTKTVEIMELEGLRDEILASGEFHKFYEQNRPTNQYGEEMYALTAPNQFLETWWPAKARAMASDFAGIGQQSTFEEDADAVQ